LVLARPYSNRLIGNSRTGAEINQSGVAFRPVGVNQYCQTWQHPVQVGGSLQTSLGYQAQPGLNTPFEQNKMDALQNLMDDMEYSSYYGRGEDPSVSGRPKQKGLRALLTSNLVTNPTSANAYKPTDLIRDTLETGRVSGRHSGIHLVFKGISVSTRSGVTNGVTIFRPVVTPAGQQKTPALGRGGE
jgi:hypothetical protein